MPGLLKSEPKETHICAVAPAGSAVFKLENGKWVVRRSGSAGGVGIRVDIPACPFCGVMLP